MEHNHEGGDGVVSAEGIKLIVDLCKIIEKNGKEGVMQTSGELLALLSERGQEIHPAVHLCHNLMEMLTAYMQAKREKEQDKEEKSPLEVESIQEVLEIGKAVRVEDKKYIS